jgi:cytochrome P450
VTHPRANKIGGSAWLDLTDLPSHTSAPHLTPAREMGNLRPNALTLPDRASLVWTSLTKTIRQPEKNWPAQLCESPIITGCVRGRVIALIADPEAARVILTGSESEFPKWRIYEKVVGAGMGRENLSASTGLRWRRQRQAFSLMFQPASASQAVPLFQAAVKQAISAWGAADDILVDAGLEMTRLALGVVWRALFCAKPDADMPLFVTKAAEHIYRAHLRGDINEPAIKIRELADAARDTAARPETIGNNPFSTWPAIDGGPTDQLSAQELYDNARNFIAAGHETTALTLVWSLWLAAQDAETQNRIHREIDEVAGPDPIAEHHIDRLLFTGRVVKEAMRLYPPGFVTVRQARQPVRLAGELLPADAILAVCIYALHRHRDWWDEPDVFRPDRFAEAEPRHRYAYLPFSAGSHVCIGAAFAWREVIVVFASILQQFRLSTDRAATIYPRASITIRPNREVPITLHRRNRIRRGA